MNYWIFQAVPKHYNIPQHMREQDREDWFVTRYVSEIKAGDVIYFWQAGKAAGIYGWGYVLSPEPYLAPDGDYRVQVSYEASFGEPGEGGLAPIPKEQLMQLELLQKLPVIQAPQGTNFRVDAEQAFALNQLIRQAGFTPPPDPAPKSIGGEP